MANIRIKDLTPDATPSKTDILAVDSLTTRGVTIENAVKIGRPFASQAEAEAGTDYTKAMNPLTVRQSTVSQVGVTIASAAQGALANSAVQPEDLSTVATSGAYADLTGKPPLGAVATSNDYGDLDNLPTLGTAAATAATDYATASQGATADSAVQSIQPGTSASVDATDPNNPVINFTGTGTGDVLGPSSATDGNVPLFDGATGKLLKNGRAIQTSATDATANSLMAVGAFGVGKYIDLRSTPFTTGTPASIYGTGSVVGMSAGGPTYLNIPGLTDSQNGVLRSDMQWTNGLANSAVIQTFSLMDGRVFTRVPVNDTTWGTWRRTDTALPIGWLSGLTLANSVADAANDIVIAAGMARDDLNTTDLNLTVGITKRLDATWVAGTNQGGLDSGSKGANLWYHAFLIRNLSSAQVDVIFSGSISNPTMPSGWGNQRRIGAVLTDGSGAIRGFNQQNDRFSFNVPIVNYSGVDNGGSTSILRNVSVPIGLKVRVELGCFGTGGTGTVYLAVSDPDAGPCTLASFVLNRIGAEIRTTTCEVVTNANSQVYTWDNSANLADGKLSLWTRSYIDPRGRF